MKIKLAAGFLILIAVIGAFAIVAARSGGESDEVTLPARTGSDQLLTLNEVKEAFAIEGLTLTSWQGREYFTLNHRKPGMFKTLDGEYAMYVFGSMCC
ncbi:hypothetical protein ACFPYJ_01485 [Paenibacillus solisilvae]|uniref:Uncharacterized protein n=1 Tax=Paenibacillus solisilvae TaxID=2486751 RepID=A0ABW0VUQ2_9BACL